MTEPKDRVLAVVDLDDLQRHRFCRGRSASDAGRAFSQRRLGRGSLDGCAITGGDSVTTVALEPITTADWSTDAEGRPLLTLTALADGDFSNYTLTITAPKLDLILNSTVVFVQGDLPERFRLRTAAGCLARRRHVPVPPIDYLSRDFQSFQQALLEFSSLRYPNWVERSEADFGMMMSEVLSAVGDELSYLQDRVAAEATLLDGDAAAVPGQPGAAGGL